MSVSREVTVKNGTRQSAMVMVAMMAPVLAVWTMHSMMMNVSAVRMFHMRMSVRPLVSLPIVLCSDVILLP